MTTSKVCFFLQKKEKRFIKLLTQDVIVLVRDNQHLQEFKDYLIVMLNGPRIPGFKIYDIAIVEKCLFVEKSMTLKNLTQYYLHKNDPGKLSPKEELKLMERLYIAQSREVGAKGQNLAVSFEISNYSVMNEIDPSSLPIDVAKLEADIQKGNAYYQSLHDPTFYNRYDIQAYLDKNIKTDVNFNGRGAYDLRHDTLLSYKDEKLKKYVYAEKARSKLLSMTRIWDKLVDGRFPFSHNVYETRTGRMGSPAVGIPKKYYDHLPNISSLDYTSFELMIYLEYFKPPIYQMFKDSGDLDFYSFLYRVVSGRQDVSDDSRKKIKKVVMEMLNGATLYGLAYSIGTRASKVRNFIEKISAALSFEHNRSDLVDHVIKNRRYSICPKLGKTFSDKYSYVYPDHLRNVQLIEMNADSGMSMTAIDRLHISEKKDCEVIINKRVMAMRVQGTAAIIIKQAVKAIHKLLVNDPARIILTRYDEIVFENASPETLEKCRLQMIKSYRDVMGSEISVK